MRRVLVFLVVWVSFFDTLAQLPIVSPYAASLGAGTLMAGFTVAAYSMANMGGNLLAGPLIDRYGRKPGMVAGMLIASAGVLLSAAATLPEHFLGARIIHGLGGAILVPAAFAYLGDRAPGSAGERAATMARSGIAIGLAALTGPPLAGILRDRIGYEAVFLGISALLALTAAATWAGLEGEGAKESRGTLSRAAGPTYRELLFRPVYLHACLSVLGLTAGKGVLALALPLHGESLGLSATRVGLLLSVFALAAIVVFALTRRLGSVSLRARILTGLVVNAVSLAVLGRLEAYAALAAAMAFFGVGFGLVFPSAAAQVALATGPESRGRAFGLYYAVFSLGVVLGPVVGGLLSSRAGVPLFATGAVMVALTAAAVWATGRRAGTTLGRGMLSAFPGLW